MTPVNNGAVFESFDNLIFLRLRFRLLEFFVDVKIVPQYDSVLNEALAVVGNILLLLGCNIFKILNLRFSIILLR